MAGVRTRLAAGAVIDMDATTAKRMDDLGRVGDGALAERGDVVARGFGRYPVQGVREVDGRREVRCGNRWVELAPDVSVWRYR
jgi:hypothetical protein